MQLPFLKLSSASFEHHLQRCFNLYQAKLAPPAAPDAWPQYLVNLYAVDWFLCIGCLEGQPRAWERLFAARASRADCLIVDALRARAVRLFPRDQERQENAVQEFWGYLLAGERDGATPILARFDGQRSCRGSFAFFKTNICPIYAKATALSRCRKTTWTLPKSR
jgi:hypothetical protein